MRLKTVNSEGETLAERKKRKALASRGKSAETKVHSFLTEWTKADLEFDYDRLLDSRSAGRIVAAQVADFLIFYRGKSGTLEVKEMKKGDRLPKRSFPQHARMVRREFTGCKGFLIVYVADTALWNVAMVADMALEAVSWKLSCAGAWFNTVKEAVDYIKLQITQ